MNYYTRNTILGAITIVEDKGFVTHLFMAEKNLCANYCETEVLKEGFKQLDEYFSGERKIFVMPLKPKGTEFQQRVWSILSKIPYGETRTYKQIAVLVGACRASRAVGQANNRNPIPIFIPCHRVVGSDNSLKGFIYGSDVKRKLLELEHVIL